MGKTSNQENIAAAKAAANQLLSVSGSLNRDISKLESIFNEMQSNGWKGNTSTTFYSNYETYHEEIMQLQTQLKDVYNAVSVRISGAEETEETGREPA